MSIVLACVAALWGFGAWALAQERLSDSMHMT